MGEQEDDLARRLARLEQRMDQEAGLRASQDRDLADLTRLTRAQDHLIEAVRLNQIDHGVRLQRIEDSLTVVNQQLGRIAGALEVLIHREGENGEQ